MGIRMIPLSGPDHLGRVHFVLEQEVEYHLYCPYCGGNVNDHVNPGTRCLKCGRESRGGKRGQAFFAVPGAYGFTSSGE